MRTRVRPVIVKLSFVSLLCLLSYSVESLWLDDNSLGGTLPTEFGRLSLLSKYGSGMVQLIFLNLVSPLLFLSFLLTEHLTLNSNQLIGSVPSELLQLPNLSESFESCCPRVCTVPPHFHGNLTFVLRNTGILSLDRNNFTGTIDLGGDACFNIELSADCDEVKCDCCGLCCYDGLGCA